jgi:hypothetical protein
VSEKKSSPNQLPVRTNRPAENLPAPTEPPTERLPVPAYTEQSLRALVRRAESGDEKTLPELRRLVGHPGVGDVVGLASRVRSKLLRKLTGENLLVREMTTLEMKTLRQELLGPAPTVIERLLVDEVVVAWLQLHDTDLRTAGVCDQVGVGNRLYRRADLVHRRFLAALRTLALVRRVAAPALQVNIAEKQVNVSG